MFWAIFGMIWFVGSIFSHEKVNGEILGYYASNFNSIGDYMDVYHYGGRYSGRSEKDDIIKELGKEIKEYGYESVIGVMLLHKHFDIFSNEMIVELIDDSKQESISQPMAIDDYNANDDIIPYRFKLALNGDLIPLEFMMLSQNMKDYDVIKERYDILIKNETSMFLEHFASVLETNNLRDIFGIALINHDSMAVYNGTMETSDTHQRILTVKPKGDEIDESGRKSVQDVKSEVFWTFSASTKRNPRLRSFWCGHSCSHSCGGHD
jgi:hypothetical protein